MVFRFGIFELDERTGELRRAGVPVSIQPKPLALLSLLVRERERVVPSEELFATLWPDAVVSPASLNRAVSHARRAIDDTGRGSLIRSIPRRGYRFTGEVTSVDPEAQGPQRVNKGLETTGADAPSSIPDARGSPSVEVDAHDVPRRRGRADADRIDEREKGAAVRAASPLRSTREELVGRRSALDALAASLVRARSGHSSIALVAGPPGIGKTRIVEHFAGEAEREGFTTIVGRCRASDGAPAFWLWAQILKRLVEHDDYRAEITRLIERQVVRELEPALAQYAPEFIESIGEKQPPAEAALPADQRRFLFFEAAGRVLFACARRRPLVVFLEDLHWAGSPSLRLLEHVASEGAEVPLMLVATIRDEPRPPDHPVDRALATLRRRSDCTDVALQSLSRGEVGEYLSQVIGRPAPTDLISELYARTEGVPLYVIEATRLLDERGDLAHPERIARQGVPLPPRARDLIRRSLEGLTPECAEMLAIAAVLGREFTLTLLAAVAERERLEVLDRCDEAVAAGVLEESPDGAGAYRFSHALFQETIYEDLATGRRARHHLAAARRLEHQYADALTPLLSDLAHHHHLAIAVGDPERAVEFARRAAAEAERLYAFEEAAVHYTQALDALRHCDPVDANARLEILLSLGTAHRFSGDRASRLAAFASAAEQARELGDSRGFANATIGFCDIGEWSAASDEAPELIDEAISRADETDLVSLARLTTRLAHLNVKDRSIAEPAGRRAVELARKSGNPEALEEALYVLHHLIAGPDGLEERRTLVDSIIDVAPDCTDRDSAVIAVLDVACDALQSGDRERALALRERASELAGANASPNMRWHLSVWDAGLSLLEGNLDEAEARADEALARGRRIGHPFARVCWTAQLTLIERDRGQPERIVERLAKALTRNRLGATHWTQAVVGRAEAELGQLDRARTLLDEALAGGVSAVARDISWSGTIVELAHLCADVESDLYVRPLLEALETAPDQHGLMPIPITYGGPLHYAIGVLRASRGERDEAIAHLEEARSATRALGAAPSLARIECDLAPLLLRAGQRERAEALLDDARVLAERIGMKSVLREIDRFAKGRV